MNWVEEQKRKIELLTSEYSFTKYNQLKISSLERLVEVSYQNAATCEKCSSNLIDLENLIDQIPKLDKIEFRKPYEKKFNAMRSHFYQNHNFYAPMYFTSIWGLILTITGAVTGAVLSYIVNRIVIVDWILIPSITGLIIAYLIGSYRDRKIRIQKKLI